ncbi:hypothetical protein Goarm_002424 [Gossypium armourianum]|uniref:Uncharacterized protein n=1 Tax=Gossypium armourianum TaxID=34283 RepID=A0A7J9K814_9ROSI|nr:hypothetical protein [Gossypium armourianum]
MIVEEADSSSKWSREQDKAFENALASYPEDFSDRWEKIAADVPGKTLEEIKEHYELLEDDVNRIESGCVPLPPYNSSESSAGDEGAGKKGSSHSGNCNSESNHGSKNSRSDQERRKGIAWTEDEHRFRINMGTHGSATLMGSGFVTLLKRLPGGPPLTCTIFFRSCFYEALESLRSGEPFRGSP